MFTVTMAFTGQSRSLHIMAGIFLLDYIFLAGNQLLVVGDNQVKFGDILPETSKSSASWDTGGGGAGGEFPPNMAVQ